ncbi:MAG: radical SAM protein [Candidatus Margulisiibacteriota bacterium]
MKISPLKIFRHPGSLRSGVNNLHTPPITLDMDLTTLCSNRCPECTYRDQRLLPARFLPKELAKKAIEQAADFGIKAITFTGGGEPVLHPDFAEIAAFSQQQGLKAGLITSGHDYSQQIAERTLPYFSWVRFSLDAGSPDVYAATHGLNANHFQRTVDNIREASAIREKNKLPVILGASYLVFQPNQTDFKTAIGLALGEMGLDRLQFKPMRTANCHMPGGTCFNFGKLESANNLLADIKRDSPYADRIILSRFSMQTKRVYRRCLGQQWTTALGSDGKLYVCCEYKYDRRYFLGDLSAQTLQDIWRSDWRKKVVESLDPNKSCFLGCKLHEMNNILADALNSPGRLEQLIEKHSGPSNDEVDFI